MSDSVKDTKHQGHKGQQGHKEAQMTHIIFSLSLRQAVGQRRLQTHKQHTGGEGYPCSNIVKNLGVIHLWGTQWQKTVSTDSPIKTTDKVNNMSHTVGVV